MEFIKRQERVNIREVSSTAKILGTAVCVGGAITIAFFKGPKLPMQFLSDPSMILHKFSSDNWVMGALFLVGSSSCWSLWLILQVNPLCDHYMPRLNNRQNFTTSTRKGLVILFPGSYLPTVHGSSVPVGLDLLPVHPAIRRGRFLPAAGP